MKSLSIYLINIAIWLAFSLMTVLFFIGVILIVITTYAFDPNRRVMQQWFSLWGRMAFWVNPFWSYQIEGKRHVNPQTAYVIVANHQSMADIMCAFATHLHYKWVSKLEMAFVPILGWSMWLNGYVFIKRGDKRSRDRCFETCRRWLEKGSSVFFFPEGTRSPDGRLQAFKPGAFKLALETGSEILPIYISGSRNAVPKHSPFISNRSAMKVKILPPVKTERQVNPSVEQIEELKGRIHGLYQLQEVV